MSETQQPQETLQITYADGSTQPILASDFFEALKAGSRVLEISISLEEGRQRAQYEGVKRFLNRKISFEQLWTWVDAIKDPEQHRRARQIAHAAIHTVTMQHEAVMFNELAHSLGRDNLAQCMRSPANPFVQTNDLEEALANAQRSGGARVMGNKPGSR